MMMMKYYYLYLSTVEFETSILERQKLPQINTKEMLINLSEINKQV